MKPKLFFFAVLFGSTPGRAEKNKPKLPDAPDVGPDSGRPEIGDGRQKTTHKRRSLIIKSNEFNLQLALFAPFGENDAMHTRFHPAF